MQVNITILFAFFCLNLEAQDCHKYNMAMAAGDKYLNKTKPPSYNKALIEFQAAQIAARECGIKTDSPAVELKKVFEGLIAQRDEAVQAKREAERQKSAAILAKKEVEAQRQKDKELSEFTLHYTKTLLTKVTTMLLAGDTGTQKEALWLGILANQVVNENPTIALRLVEVAMQKDNDSFILKAAQQIYEQYAFYKTIVKGSHGGLHSFALSPTGKEFITGWGDGIVRSYKKDGTILKEFKTNSAGAIAALAFSVGGDSMLTGSMDASVRLWDKNGILLKKFERQTNTILTVAFSPDGSKILIGNYDGVITLLSIDGHVIKTFQKQKDAIRSVAFSPTGELIVMGCEDGTSILFNKNGNLLMKFKGHTGGIRSVVFSPDGKKILTGSMDNTAKLWNIDGTFIKEFNGLAGGVLSVAFSQDGEKILTGFETSSAKLWSIDGTELRNFKADGRGIVFVTFLPNENYIVTASMDGTVRSWNINGSFDSTSGKWQNKMSLKEFLQSDMIDPLTEIQKKQFGIK
ncbi:MAG: WD40 repeat domain-containing protein [Ginsengibacter sp.]